MFGQRLGFDPRSDPRAEKPGRKQRRKAYLRAMKSCGKPALFSQNPSEGVPIDSSHAGGHWFESSSLHQILGNQVFPRIFSVFPEMLERLRPYQKSRYAGGLIMSRKIKRTPQAALSIKGAFGLLQQPPYQGKLKGLLPALRRQQALSAA